MDIITQFVECLMLTIGAVVCLVIGSVFVGLALMIMRTLWRVAGDNFDSMDEEKRFQNLRRDK